MASIIRIKRSSTNGNPATLGAGELAYSALSGTLANGGDRLYIGMGTETSGNATNHFVIGGKYFTDMMDHATGTLTASSAVLVDANSKVDVFNVDNLRLDSNTISSTDTNGNITLDPNGTGYVEIIGTNAVVLPVGTTLQRGPANQGAIRFNTSSSTFEGYDGSQWGSLGGVKSVDGLTYITAEATPGASDDTIRFYNNGVLTAYIDPTTFRIGSTIVTQIDNTTASTTSANGALTVVGGVGIGGALNVGGALGVTGNTVLNSNVTLVGSNTAAQEFFKIQNASGTDKFSVDSATGNTSIAGELSVTGNATFGNMTIGDIIAGDLAVNGGDFTTTATTFNFLTGTATTVNLATAATTLSIGAGTGTTTVNNTTFAVTNNATVGGTLGVTGDVTFNANVTLVGSDTSATELLKIKNGSGVDKFVVDSASGNTSIAGTLGVTGTTSLVGDTTLTGDLAVNGGDITTTAATFNLLDTTASTINFAGAATALTIGGTTGTTTIRNTTVAITNNATVGGTLGVTGNTTLSGTLGVTGDTTLTGDLAVNGGDLTTTAGTFNLLNATATTINFAGAATTLSIAANSGTTTVNNALTVTGATTLSSTLQVNGAATIGQSGTRVATTVYGTTFNITGSDSSTIGVTAGAAQAKTLTIVASNSVGDASLDINVDDTAELDATTISLDATDSSNFSMTANSASTKILTIDANNTGAGEGNIAVGSANTDNVVITSSTKTDLTSAEVEINGATTVDINSSGTLTVDATTSATITTPITTINSDTVTIRGTEGSGDTSAVTITGSLDVDNIKLDGNTISTTDGSNTIYIDPAPSGSAGLVVIEGNLQVNGTQTTVNSTTVTIDDPIFVLGGDTAPTSDDNLDRGIEYQWHNGTSAKIGFFGYDDSASEFVFVPDATDTAGVISGTLGAVAFGTARLDGTTASTTTSNGALTVAGGVGIGGQLNVAGATNKFTANTASTSTSTGAVVITGGIGVGESMYIGNDIIGAGAATSMIDGFDIDGGTY